MKKIKVLVISNDNDGVGYYRINSPYLSINEPNIEIRYLPSSDFTFRFDEETLKEFNVIVYHKGIPFKDKNNVDNFTNIIKKYDIKIIYDIDDHWLIDPTHVNYKTWKSSNAMEKVLQNIKSADYVTTTTPIFADDIKEHNKNVVVIENAINHNEKQWLPNKIDSDKTRFIWGGGITHRPDLALITDSIKQMDNEFRKYTQLYMCGYDLRVRTKKGIFIGDPKTNMWGTFESYFTNNNRWLDNPIYKEWLLTYNDNGRMNYGYNDEFRDEFYQRRWTKPIFTYGTMYNEADVALAPLKNGITFNNVKSQLKVIEAGIHKCPIIASNTGPYTIDVVDGKHGFLINENDKIGWYNKMKFFKENPNAILDMGGNLNELVLKKYTLEKANQKRIDLLNNIF